MTAMDGLILAGGKGSRMGGIYKGGLFLKEQTFTQCLVKEFQRGTQKIWISYGKTMHGEEEGCEIVRDIYPGCGPLGGLHAGLCACTGELMLAAACDMPFLKMELYQDLAERMLAEENRREKQLDGVVPYLAGRMHPLAAVYRKEAAVRFAHQIQTGDYRIRNAFSHMDILYVTVTEDSRYAGMLRNINTLEEYEMNCAN